MANCHGRIVLTRYRSSDEVRLSTQAAAGNLAGNSDAWLLNALNLFKKFPRFESSPGHQSGFLHVFQCLPRSRKDSNFGTHHR